MSYVSTTNSQLTPDYFRREALAYSKSIDRKAWLNRQIINLQAALNSYKARIETLMAKGAQLDGKSTAAQWMQAIGGIAITIPTPYTLIGGAVLSVAGTIVNAFERKKDSKALQQLATEAREIQIEAQQIQTYYENYTAELQKLNLMPLALFGTALYIFLKK